MLKIYSKLSNLSTMKPRLYMVPSELGQYIPVRAGNGGSGDLRS